MENTEKINELKEFECDDQKSKDPKERLKYLLENCACEQKIDIILNVHKWRR